MTDRIFPIMALSHREREDIAELRAAGTTQLVIALPWSLLAPHERQAQANHGQSLERLAARGGLGLCEAVAVLEDRRWHRMTRAEANAALVRIMAAQP